tara:strand:+ start:1596 stop:1853 length:258 start_codon:yes stop_codon:yes gene_type:complete
MADLTKVKSLEHLKELCQSGKDDFCLLLNFGVRSSKSITYSEGEWSVLHEIDGTYAEYDNDEQFTESEGHIMLGILQGAFMAYNW